MDGKWITVFPDDHGQIILRNCRWPIYIYKRNEDGSMLLIPKKPKKKPVETKDKNKSDNVKQMNLF